MLSSPPVDRVPAGPGTTVRPLLDTGAAVLVVGVFWLPPTSTSGNPSLVVAAAALALVTGAAMVLRWRLPASSVVAAGVATVAGTVLGVCEDPLLATAWCLYPLAVARASRARAAALVGACLLAGLAMVTGVPGDGASGTWQRWLLAAVAVSAAWLLGTTVGRQLATAREAERVRVQLEVARDVHDVVGHALGVISAEAGVTRSLPDAGEQELRDALADVEAHARRALGEVQAVVRALRDPTDPVGGTGPRLSSVVAATRAAGVDVEARIDVAEHLDDAVGAVVVRIVQECLSNVLRHAPGAGCTVAVHEDGGAIVVRVTDRGPGAGAGAAPGFGLQGMRERARQVGGSVTWGDHPRGGFEVTGRLPVRGGR